MNKNLISTENNGSLSFGDYRLTEKTKLNDYEHEGDLYKIKTFNEITKLEKNGLFVYESVPGSMVREFRMSMEEVSFKVEAEEDVQITLGLSEDTLYEIYVDGESIGAVKTNMSGKLLISVELEPGKQSDVTVCRR